MAAKKKPTKPPTISPDRAPARIKELRAYRNQLVPPDSDPSLTRHRSRGKLFVRDRINALIDPSSPFIEIGQLAGLNLYEGVRAGAGIVAGIGVVSGRPCMLVANDATVKGGTYFPMTVKKHLRAQEIARNYRLPCIYLVDSGGAFLPLQDEVFPDRFHFGRIFYNQAQLSAAGIPQISVVLGSCTAGGAYVPAMSDQSIIVKNQGTIFLGGPPLVKAATGEDVTAEELGGGEVHSIQSGVTDYLAASERDAILQTRTIIRDLAPTPFSPFQGEVSREPQFDPQEIYNLIPTDPKKVFPMRDILLRIVDNGSFDEFKKTYGTSIICAFARIEGHLIGVVANDGILFSESSLKAAHFIELCNQRGIPLVFFQNIVGFMIGKEYERRGIAKDGAKMVMAVACAKVPKFTVIVGNSFGAGNYGMCGRAYEPDLLFSWPNSRIAVMGPQQASSVLAQVREEGQAARGEKIDKKALDKYRAETEARYEEQASAWYATARLWDDGVIDPIETRPVLGFALSIRTTTEPPPRDTYGVFRM